MVRTSLVGTPLQKEESGHLSAVDLYQRPNLGALIAGCTNACSDIQLHALIIEHCARNILTPTHQFFYDVIAFH
jgi:hypothetical protein